MNTDIMHCYVSSETNWASVWKQLRGEVERICKRDNLPTDEADKIMDWADAGVDEDDFSSREEACRRNAFNVPAVAEDVVASWLEECKTNE